MKKTAVGYVRCSTDMQDDSIRQQRAEIEKYATAHDYNLVDWYEDEGFSGTTFLKRPGFVKMLKTIQDGRSEFKYILAYDESRWGRTSDNTYWKQKFRIEYSIGVVLVKTNSNTGNEVADGVLGFFEGYESKEYSRKLSVSTLRGAMENAKKGHSCGGTAPYGYKRVAVGESSGQFIRDLKDGNYIRKEEGEKASLDLGEQREAETVRTIFQEKINGLGYVAIANLLNTRNLPPPKRGRWRNKDQKWCGGTIRTILDNPTYYGARVYNRHPQSHLSGPAKPVWLNRRDEWVVVEDVHPAIISKETFLLANQDRKEYARKNRYFYDSPYLLSGLIKCSHCGFNFHGQKHGQKNVWYYVDGGYINKGKAVCTDYKINKKELESFVIKAVRSKILNSDLPKRVEEMLMKKINESSAEKYSVIERYQRSLGEVKAKIDRLITLVENGLNIEEVLQRVKETKKERQAIEQKIEQLQVSNITPREIIDAKSQVQYLMENFEGILSSAPFSVQKELLRKFIQKIEVDRVLDSVIVYLKKIPVLSGKLQALSTGSGVGEDIDDGCLTAEKRLRKGQFQKRGKISDIRTEQRQGSDVFTENQTGTYPKAV